MSTAILSKLNIKKHAALAPMASVADRAYRRICREHGAVLTVSEMVSAKGLVYGDKKTADMVITDDGIYALQFFTSEPDVISEAIKMLPGICEAKNCRLPDIIDINMGCPVPKVVGNGCGSALMKDTRLAAGIVSAAVKAAEEIQQDSVPVSVKFRSGWDEKSINAVDFARALEATGASLITVHPRTRTQLYGGKADIEIIQNVKSAVNIPVIGSGDIKTPEDAKAMYEQTGCDLVMVGRGSYGRPWIFSQIAEFLETGAYSPEPEVSERARIMLRQVSYAVSEKGEHTAIREARQKCAFYVRGLPHAAEMRRLCGGLSSFSDVEELARMMRDSGN